MDDPVMKIPLFFRVKYSNQQLFFFSPFLSFSRFSFIPSQTPYRFFSLEMAGDEASQIRRIRGIVDREEPGTRKGGLGLGTYHAAPTTDRPMQRAMPIDAQV